MSNLRVLTTKRSEGADRVIRMLEDTIDRVRSEGVSQVSIFYSPADGSVWHHEHHSENVTELVGAMESAKFDVLREAVLAAGDNA